LKLMLAIFKVDPVFNRKPVKLPKKFVEIGIVGVKHNSGQNILNFLKFGNKMF